MEDSKLSTRQTGLLFSGYCKMKPKKPKFVQILMGTKGGCGEQISQKENYILSPIKVMKKKGFLPEIWTLEKGVERERWGAGIRRFPNLVSLLANLFLDKDVKLVHAHLRPYLPSLLSPVSLKGCILMPHIYELGSNWLIKKISLFFMKRFHRIIALTPYERDIYIRNGIKKEKIMLMPHAIDWEFFSKKTKQDESKIKKRYGISKDDFVIVSVSNFRKFKNLDSMITAFGMFNSKVKKSKFVVVGKNQMNKAKYKEQNAKRYKEVRDPEKVIDEQGLRDRVILTGSLDYKKVREILSIADVFANNSDPETFGLAVYEAASAGVPLCLSDIGSFRTVFGEKALYSKPRDEKTLAEQFMKYYKNPGMRKKLGGKLKEYAKRLDYPTFIKKLERFYSDVIN